MGTSGQPNWVKYWSFGIQTEPNKSHLVDENKGYTLFGQFFPMLLYFYATILKKINLQCSDLDKKVYPNWRILVKIENLQSEIYQCYA